MRGRQVNSRRELYFAFGLVGLAVALGIAALILKVNSRKVYTQSQFETAVLGRSESEVIALLGEPYVTGSEPQQSPYLGRRYVGYVMVEDSAKWCIQGDGGGVVIYFASGSGKADHIDYVQHPDRRNGGFILIRW
jgi:hypothetical protein